MMSPCVLLCFAAAKAAVKSLEPATCRMGGTGALEGCGYRRLWTADHPGREGCHHDDSDRYDADAHGFVSNFARPGGNITGMSLPSGELSTKWLEFLIEILSHRARFAALWDTSGTANQVRLTEQAARTVGVDLRILPVVGLRDFTAAFAAAKQSKTQGLLILGSPVMTTQMEALAKLALEHGLAAIYTYREFTQAGGTLSYGPRETDPNFAFRHAADFVDKILRGAKPGDLPVEQPMRYDLTVNLKTAETLGVTIPATLLDRADEVFE